jgi:hypothetical protein
VAGDSSPDKSPARSTGKGSEWPGAGEKRILKQVQDDGGCRASSFGREILSFADAQDRFVQKGNGTQNDPLLRSKDGQDGRNEKKTVETVCGGFSITFHPPC